MPLMKLRRKFRLATTKGHSVLFEPDTPVFVPNSIVPEAVAVGAELAEEGELDVTPKEPPAPNTGPADASSREGDILKALNALVARNDRDDFTGGGLPKIYAVSGLVGYKVEKRELEAVWLKRAEMIAEGLLAPDGTQA